MEWLTNNVELVLSIVGILLASLTAIIGYIIEKKTGKKLKDYFPGSELKARLEKLEGEVYHYELAEIPQEYELIEKDGKRYLRYVRKEKENG